MNFEKPEDNSEQKVENSPEKPNGLKKRFEELEEELPELQMNTRTEATQKFLDFCADVYDVPRFDKGLESDYVSWLQNLGSDAYNASFRLNNLKSALREISKSGAFESRVGKSN